MNQRFISNYDTVLFLYNRSHKRSDNYNTDIQNRLNYLKDIF
jgi:2,4-dienoyl-CoA reductase-like NADH-dependent reductase (Old Yellow Enzyme family)